ncbi:unnamed protein product [Periconia digitata]|uniref:Uncharacterized protein n=1 Tax=Periconia digitata TaxID=1303443 RepID=A0A9W4XVJ7_9PLEO|nr:unnamed protein product [Periconia digitata]
MKSFAAIVAFAAAASASAVYAPINSTVPAPPVYSTTVVPQYTTVCSAGATVSYGPSSYSTVSKPTTLTIPNYTIVTPVPLPSAPVESKPVPSAPVYTTAPAPSAPVYPTANGTVPAPPAPTGTAPGAPGASAPPNFPGAAGKTGLSLLAVAGALAAFL